MRLYDLLLSALVVSAPGALGAQVVASPRGTVLQEISGTEISIDYSRPSMRGRESLFGDQIPWGRTWTPGANASTTFRFSKDVTLAGVAVPAGKYGVWIEVRESEPWILMLHADTTLFHTVHPTLDDAFVTMPVEPSEGRDHVETLTFAIDGIRADRAVLELRWGHLRLPIDLGVDPGFTLAVDAGEAARYEGTWTLDKTPSMPADSTVARWREGMPEDQLQGLDAWLESLSTPHPVRIEHEPATGRLLAYDPVEAKLWDADPDEPIYQLVPKAEGIFLPGMLQGGELAFLNEFPLWEFTFGPDGRADGFSERDHRDEVTASGDRSSGG